MRVRQPWHLMSNAEFLRALCEAHGAKLCERCKCCEMLWEDCESCGGDGVSFGYEYEDGDFAEDATCEVCYGAGGWDLCDCNDDGQHYCSNCNGAGHTSLSCKAPRMTK